MPSAKDNALEKEAKRRRGIMSCAECRRLKLKCDKLVPCSSCTRRGCKDICPTGSLVTGQGTRFVLADTHKLHTKIAQMSERIRTLEDALEVLQSQNSNEPHPLLSRELLNIKSSLDLHAAVDDNNKNRQISENKEEPEEVSYIDAFGTLAIREDGSSTFYGRSAGHESILLDDEEPRSANPFPRRSQSVPSTGSDISNSFPFSHSIPNVSMHTLRSYLPSWPDACKLCDLYLEFGPWFYGAVTKTQLEDEVIPMWYRESPKRTSDHDSKEGDAHDLALVFIIFCFGVLTDDTLPAPPENKQADWFFNLTKAALSLEPPLERLPSVATVQALSMMGIFQGLCNNENSIETMWAYFGLSTKLAQTIGLHKDCARWKLSPSEVQKRRALFYELLITDGWQSLSTGRLPTFSMPFVDCELPLDTDEQMDENGAHIPSFPHWKARFGAECVSAVVQGTLTSRAPKYSVILDLDRKVRDMELPKYAEGPHPIGATLGQTMAHFMPRNYRELTLLYIHRCFFAHAVSSSPLDPIKSQYAPSFLAGYRSARELVLSVKTQFHLFPAKVARFWVLWTHAFSASIMLASVVTHAPKSKVAAAALLELKTALSLFEEASRYGGRAVKFLPVLKRLWDKAQTIYINTRSGVPPPHDNDIFSLPKSESEPDQLSIFGGKTHTVTPKNTSRSHTSSPHSSAENTPAPVPAFLDAHPSLVQAYQGFDQQISAQIREAYSSRDDTFMFSADAISSPESQTQSPHVKTNPYPSPSAQSLEPASYPTSPIEQPNGSHNAFPPQQPSQQHSQSYVSHDHNHVTHSPERMSYPSHPPQPQVRHYNTYPSDTPGPSKQSYPYYPSEHASGPQTGYPPQPQSYPGQNMPYWNTEPSYPAHAPQQQQPAHRPHNVHQGYSRNGYSETYPQHQNVPSSAVMYYQQQQQQYLQPAATHMQGWAADDRGLQATWTQYMERMASPRQFSDRS